MDTYPLVAADLRHEVVGIDKDPTSENYLATITMSLTGIKDEMFNEPSLMHPHTLGNNAEAVNVVFGTSATPPAANTVPQGTIYIQYVP